MGKELERCVLQGFLEQMILILFAEHLYRQGIRSDDAQLKRIIETMGIIEKERLSISGGQVSQSDVDTAIGSVKQLAADVIKAKMKILEQS